MAKCKALPGSAVKGLTYTTKRYKCIFQMHSFYCNRPLRYLPVPTARRATAVMSDNARELHRSSLLAVCAVDRICLTEKRHQSCCCTLRVESQNCPLHKAGDGTNRNRQQHLLQSATLELTVWRLATAAMWWGTPTVHNLKQ